MFGYVCVRERKIETAEAAKQEIMKWREKVSKCEIGSEGVRGERKMKGRCGVRDESIEMKKKHLGNGGRMKKEEVRISRPRGEGRQLGRSACLPGGETGLRKAVVHLHLIRVVVPSFHHLL